jgi:predicted dienelactone hydrolase
MEVSLKRFLSVAALAVALLVMAECVWAQELVQAPRPDGVKTPLRVYAPNAAGCAPLALISPGAGGSEDGYKYLAEGLRDAGWRAVVMGHKESGEAALRADMKDSGGVRKGVRELVNDPAAYSARLIDIKAALDWASSTCKPPYRVLIGHSMGARTVMVEAGAKNKLGLVGLHRFHAYVAMSPDGPDTMFPEHAWSGIATPMLILTGTRDKSMETGSYESRTIPYDDMPAGCKWLGVIAEASHMNFAGVGFAGSTEKLVLLETKAFLDGVRGGKCGAPVAAEGIAVKSK